MDSKISPLDVDVLSPLLHRFDHWLETILKGAESLEDLKSTFDALEKADKTTLKKDELVRVGRHAGPVEGDATRGNAHALEMRLVRHVPHPPGRRQ